MKLPNSSIGISDVLQWRDCPARFALGMRRHTEAVPGEDDENNSYGSAIHDAIFIVEGGVPPRDAVSQVWPMYVQHLDPDDLALLHEDLATYRRNTPLGMELVTAETDARVPLFMHEGEQVWFRFKLDALYRRIDDHGVFFHRDYKSSKWRKTQAEVDKDLQMWAYNWGIHELYPECTSLLQSYEQLKFGNNLTSKNAEQRASMKAWLIETVKAILADETLAPKQNQWCPWCPLVVGCPETVNATDSWRMRLTALAPLHKEGRKLRVEFPLEAQEMDSMIRDVLPRMIATRKHIEAAEGALKQLIEQLPTERRVELGWRLRERKAKVLSPEGLKLLHEALGDSFYEAISVTKSALEKVASSEDMALVRSLELEQTSPGGIVPA